MASVLVVLMFLLTSPFLTVIDRKGIVNLPKASAATSQPGALREDAITVSVTRDGHVFYRDLEVERSELPARIWESIRGGAPIKVYVRADARARAGDVNRAIDEIQRAGIRDLVIVAEKANR